MEGTLPSARPMIRHRSPPPTAVLDSQPAQQRQAYDQLTKLLQDLSQFLKYNILDRFGCYILSRPLQRKLATLTQCAVNSENLVRMRRATRTLAERAITELVMHYQSPQQVSAQLWASVRARGCQFLGPAMQDEVLKLILLALEDGTALSRKVIVMFVVQRLEPMFPHASKTSVGHVVQLLYRASCFTVIKREKESSLMRLKEEFRGYLPLRREHDTQIVQVALECGIRIVPDQWSALLYGDLYHRSYMQSIIDKLQIPQPISHSAHDLYMILHRSCSTQVVNYLRIPLETISMLDLIHDANLWRDLAPVLEAVHVLMEFLLGLRFDDENLTGINSSKTQTNEAESEDAPESQTDIRPVEAVSKIDVTNNNLPPQMPMMMPPRQPFMDNQRPNYVAVHRPFPSYVPIQPTPRFNGHAEILAPVLNSTEAFGAGSSGVKQPMVLRNNNPEWPSYGLFSPAQPAIEQENPYDDELVEEILALERSLDVLRE